ncbi:MAG: hypothetical protein LPK02_11030 [Rhodobacterales bacterium]|nr:hypothetical protein [Rhodobacterales bacterium]
MTQKNIFRTAACIAVLSLGATGAVAGSKPASPTPVVPAPPPAPPPVAIIQSVTPTQARAAQALANVILNNPPPAVTGPFKARTVNVLNQVLNRPDLHGPLGLSPAQIQTMINQVQAIPVTPG